MTKNNENEQVKIEMKVLNESPAIAGTDFDNAVLGEIHNEGQDKVLSMLKAFNLGRRSVAREGRAGREKLHSIEDLVLELDGEVNAVGTQVRTIEDVQITLGRLREDMDNVDMEYLKNYFVEFHRSVRMLDELLRSSSRELGTYFQDVYVLKEELNELRSVKEQQKSPSHGNAKSPITKQ